MFGRRNPRSLPPFQKGELSSSKLNSLRIAASKRIRGLLGRESASSVSTANKDQSIRERLFAVNHTGESIPAFSIFTIKKSGEIDYAWGPPVRTEGNSFEHGFVYYTNGDFEIIDGEGHWCQVIGDLPVLIRSGDNLQEPPKIGHPIGPLNDGTLSIERCGYVVVAEPWSPGDMGLEGNYVWITKSNDQVIRVKLKADISKKARGDVYVLNEQDITVNIFDPNTVTLDPNFEVRKVINLTQRDLKAGYVTYAHPVLGVGYAIIEPTPAMATIVFTMLTDRTREVVDGLTIGHANVLITGKVGIAPDNVGDFTQVVFADMLWLGAVTGCIGIADYIDGYWIVKDCHELTAGFWFITLENRSGTGDQDVLVTLTKNIGHANADFPREDWIQQTSGQTQSPCGFIRYYYFDGEGWLPDFDNWDLDCCIPYPPGHPEFPGFPPNPVQGDTFDTDVGFQIADCGTPQDPQTIKVRYKAGTFPHMLAGAIGFALLDVDVENLTSNSTMRYYVIQSDQHVLYFTAVLRLKMCGGDAEIGTNVLGSFFPFGQAPVGVTTVANPRAHYGEAGDTIVAEWMEGTQQWEVVDVTKHAITVSSITTSIVDGCTTHSYASGTIAIERCEPAGQSTTLISYRKQTVTDLVGARIEKNQTGSDSGSQQPTCLPKLVLDITQYQAYVICDDPVPTTVEMPLLVKNALISFDANGCPMWLTQSLIVMEVCGDAVLNEATCEPCPADSASQ